MIPFFTKEEEDKIKELLIGEDYQECVDELKKKNYKYRVRSIDGQGMMGTCDLVPTRVNLQIENDKVTGVSFG